MSLKSLANEMAKIRKEVSDKGQELIKQEAKVLFDKFPDLQFICWTQFTPYFNDGDACTFSFYGAQAYAGNYPTEDESAYQDRDYEELCSMCNLGQDPENPVFDVKIHQAINDFSRSLDQLGDTLQDAIGDHCSVVITRESIRVDEYEHE